MAERFRENQDIGTRNRSIAQLEVGGHWPITDQQLVEDADALLIFKVERYGALAPVGEGDRHVDAAAVGADALGGQSAVGVAVRVFDADYIRTPVRQKGASDGDEDPLGEFDNADA